MATTSPTASPVGSPLRTAGVTRTVVLLAAGFLVAGAATSLVAGVATALGAGFPPLTPALYLPFVAVGLLAAFAGWRLVRARTARPFAVLRVLVPSVLVLSFIPDVALMILGFIPGSSVLGVIALMIMHLIVAGVAVPMSQALLPVARATDAR